MTAKPTSKPGAGRKVSKVAGKVAGPVKKTIKRETIKTKTIKAANPVGRPTLYREVYAEQAYRLCLLGATDEELADFLHIAVSTLNKAMSALIVETDFLFRERPGAQRLASCARPNVPTIYASPDNFPSIWSQPHEIFSSTV